MEPQLPEPAGPDSTRSDSEIAILRFCEHLKRILGTPSSAPAPAPSPPLSGTREPAGPADLAELREAGRRAIEIYPGPVGDLIARELEAAAAFGFRIASGTPFQCLVDHLLDRPPPTAPVAEPDQRIFMVNSTPRAAEGRPDRPGVPLTMKTVDAGRIDDRNH